MFGINKYILIGFVFLLLIMSGTSYTFYNLYTNEKVKTSILQNKVDQLEVSIKEKTKELQVKEELNRQIDMLLNEQRNSLDKKTQELEDLKDQIILNIPGANDDAHEIFRKYFEGKSK